MHGNFGTVLQQRNSSRSHELEDEFGRSRREDGQQLADDGGNVQLVDGSAAESSDADASRSGPSYVCFSLIEHGAYKARPQGGFSDRLQGITTAFFMAARTERAFLLNWPELERVLEPSEFVQWNLTATQRRLLHDGNVTTLPIFGSHGSAFDRLRELPLSDALWSFITNAPPNEIFPTAADIHASCFPAKRTAQDLGGFARHVAFWSLFKLRPVVEKHIIETRTELFGRYKRVIALHLRSLHPRLHQEGWTGQSALENMLLCSDAIILQQKWDPRTTGLFLATDQPAEAHNWIDSFLQRASRRILDFEPFTNIVPTPVTSKIQSSSSSFGDWLEKPAATAAAAAAAAPTRANLKQMHRQRLNLSDSSELKSRIFFYTSGTVRHIDERSGENDNNDSGEKVDSFNVYQTILTELLLMGSADALIYSVGGFGKLSAQITNMTGPQFALGGCTKVLRGLELVYSDN